MARSGAVVGMRPRAPNPIERIPKRASSAFSNGARSRQDERPFRLYLEKYPVLERTFRPSCLGRMTILRKESSLMGLLG
jgi:hypothetical protein